jgi:hypothetical protein
VSAHSALMALRSVPELSLKPPVVVLDLHLEGEKQIFVVEQHGEDVRDAQQRALDRAALRPSKLEAYFVAAAEGRTTDQAGRVTSATDLAYEAMPRYFTWETTDTGAFWKPRKRVDAASLGRLRWVHPKAGELFFLRRLLLSKHGVGACSYEDLRTVDGDVHSTFKGACVALGMINGSAEYADCLAEAARCRTAARVRQLYVSILHSSLADVGDPAALFAASFDAMTEDWRSRRSPAVRAADSRGATSGDGNCVGHGNYSWLHLLSDADRKRALTVLLAAELRQLSFKTGEELEPGQLGLPDISADDRRWAQAFVDAAVADGMLASQHTNAADAVSAACPDAAFERAARVRGVCAPSRPQQDFVDLVTAALGGSEGGVFFLSAGAGTGKTFTLNLLINELRSNYVNVRAMASSGIASQLLPQPARTVHSACCVPRGVVRVLSRSASVSASVFVFIPVFVCRSVWRRPASTSTVQTCGIIERRFGRLMCSSVTKPA